MTQPTGDGAQSGATGTPSGTVDPTSQQQGATSEGQPTDDGAQSGTGTGQQPEATVSRADFERLQNQLRAADQNRQKAENDLKQLRDKDLPELDKLRRDNQELAAKAEKAAADLAEARISNAFLTANKHEWANPATALKLLDRSKITIDSAGEVMGVADAADALAKSDPYLLKPKTAAEGTGTGEPPKGGTIPGNNGGGSGQPTKDQLAKRFQILNTRH